MKRTSLHWLQAAACCLLIACAGEPSAPQLTPQYSNDNSGVGPGLEHDPFPNLSAIALYRSPPSAQTNAFSLIGPGGGSLRLGDFEIVVPAGAVSRPTMFHIVLPADPKDRSKAAAEIGPHQIFRVPITLRTPGYKTWFYGAPTILWWNDRAWQAMPTVVLPDGRFETQANHLSFWGTYSGTYRGVITAGG